ncbi:MAG: DNA/RNA nuclease SfsA [Bacillota bacterium]
MNTVMATFLERPNRFVARILLPDGSERVVHVASSGRMEDVLVPGAPVVATLGEPESGRKTTGRLVMAQVGETWVSVDTALPGRLFRQAVAAGQLPEFAGYTAVRPEYPYGQSRMDFLLTAPDLPPCLVEVKSVTSALPDPDGVVVARFPDAPTARGAKHLHELMAAVREGYRAVACFLIQRGDAEAFGPYEAIDPAFGKTLREAVEAGVEVRARRLQVRPGQIHLDSPVQLRL